MVPELYRDGQTDIMKLSSASVKLSVAKTPKQRIIAAVNEMKCHKLNYKIRLRNIINGKFLNGVNYMRLAAADITHAATHNAEMSARLRHLAIVLLEVVYRT
jgi:hypothetical protein